MAACSAPSDVVVVGKDGELIMIGFGLGTASELILMTPRHVGAQVPHAKFHQN